MFKVLNKNMMSVGVQSSDGKLHRLSTIIDSQIPSKFLVIKVIGEDEVEKIFLRVGRIPGDDIFHRGIFTNFLKEINNEKHIAIPLYGGKIIIDGKSKSIIVGDRSTSYYATPNWNEICTLIISAKDEKFNGYTLICKDNLRDSKNILEIKI